MPRLLRLLLLVSCLVVVLPAAVAQADAPSCTPGSVMTLPSDQESTIPLTCTDDTTAPGELWIDVVDVTSEVGEAFATTDEDGDPALLYDPNGYEGSEQIQFTVTDDDGEVGNTSFGFDVVLPDPAPFDCFGPEEPESVEVGSTGHSFFIQCERGDLGEEDFQEVAGPAAGNDVTYVGSSGGGQYEFSYVPADDFQGLDEWSFRATHPRDITQGSEVVDVAFDVNDGGPSCGAIANGEVTAPTIAMRPNHTRYIFPPCTPSSFEEVDESSIEAPAHGTLDLDGDTSGFVYTPAKDSQTAVTLEYDVVGNGITRHVVQPITFSPAANGLPVCMDPGSATVRVGEDEALDLDCFDPDDDVLTLKDVALDQTKASLEGSSRGDSPGTFAVGLTGVAVGTTQLTYDVSDRRGADVAGPPAGIEVLPARTPPANEAPTCRDTPQAVSGIKGRQVVVSPQCSDEGLLTYQVTQAPASGTATPSGSSITYQPAGGQVTADSFVVKATDAAGLTDTLTVDVTLTDLPTPTCTSPSQALTVRPGTAVSVPLTCTNTAGLPMTYTFTGSAAPHVGTPTGGSVTYTAPANAADGAVQLTYTARVEGTGPTSSPPVTRTIDIDAEHNTEPFCEADSGWGSDPLVRAGGTIEVVVFCDDPDGDQLDVGLSESTASAGNTRGEADLELPAEQGPGFVVGLATYRAARGTTPIAPGPDAFDWTVQDRWGEDRIGVQQRISQPISVRAADSNHAPGVFAPCDEQDGPHTAFGGATTTVELLCADLEGDDVDLVVAEDGAHGDAQPGVGTNEHGYEELRYTPDAGYTGPDEVVVQLRDERGALSAPVTVAFDVEQPAGPTTTLTANPATLVTNVLARSFGFSAPGATGFVCKLDDVVTSCGTSPKTVTLTNAQEGTHTFSVQAANGTAQGPVASHTWTLDRTAPVTVVTGGPGARTNAQDATFTLDQTDANPDRLECAVKPPGGTLGAFETCGPTKTLTAMAVGAWELRVRAVDDAGNADTTPEIRTWTVDRTEPAVTLSSDPATGITNDPERDFTYTSEPGVTFACTLDGTTLPAQECDGTTTVDVAAGEHLFTVVATDQAGNQGSNYAMWTVDLTKPELHAISGGPTGTVASSTATFGAFTSPSGDVAGYECQINGGGFTPCPSNPVQFTELADGEKTLAVKAIDQAGNRSDQRTWSWTIDTTPPSTNAITGGGLTNGRTNATSITFDAFTATGDATAFQCRTTAPGGTPSAFAACPAGPTFPLGAEGPHRIEVRALDALGNADASPSLIDVVVDRTGPSARITSGPLGETAATTAKFAFGADEDGAFECRLDGATEFSACPVSRTFGGLTEGVHVLRVRAIDALGNAGTPVERTWQVVGTAPATTKTQGDLGADDTLDTGDGTPQPGKVTVAVTTPVATELTVTEQASPVGTPPPDDGFSVLGYGFDFDSAELEAVATGREPIELRFVIPADVLPAGFGPADVATLAVFRDGTEIGTTCGAAPCVQQRTALMDGGTLRGVALTVRTDHLSAWNFAVDDTDPQTTITGGTSGTDADGSVAFQFASSESGSTFRCRLVGRGALSSCTSGKAYTGLADGSYTFEVVATDKHGNADPTPATRAFSVKRPATQQPSGGDKPPSGGSTPPAAKPQAATPQITPTSGPSLFGARMLTAPKQKLAAALKRGFMVNVGCSASCRISATLSVPGAVAKKLKFARSARKPVVVARGSATGSGRFALKLRFTAKAKKALRRQRSVRLTLNGTAAADGASVPVRGGLLLRK